MRPLSRLGAAIAASLTALCLTASPVLAAETTPGDDGGGLNQVIDPNQQQGTGQVVLDAGHLDYGPTLSTGEWRVQIHDDTGVPRYWRMPEDVVMQVHDDAVLEVPEGEDYEFLGVDPGTAVHVIPQSQHPEVVWTGWNTQEPNVIEQVDLGVTMSLVGFEGPGDLVVFLQSGNFGAPEQLYSTYDQLPQQTWIELNTHTHANWAFTEPGVYLVEIQFDATLRDGTSVSAHDTLRFSVGDEIDPQTAFDAQLEEAAIVDTTVDTTEAPSSEAEEGAASGQSESAVPTLVWIVAGVIGAAIVIGVVVMAISTARMKRKIREARAQKLEARKPDAEAER